MEDAKLALDRRLKLHAVRDGECLVWNRGLLRTGYGRISIQDRQQLAHRVAYELWVGPIPEGLELDHLCRVRNCIEPSHLEPVTHGENLRRRQFSPGGGCKHGHSPDDYYIQSRGTRCCRTCKRDQLRAYRARGRS